MSHSNLAEKYAPDTRRLERMKQEAAQGRARLAAASTLTELGVADGDQVAAAKRFVEKMRTEMGSSVAQPAKAAPANQPAPSSKTVIANPPRTAQGASRLVELLDTYFPRPVATSFFAAPAVSVDDESDEQPETCGVIDAADITDAKLDLDDPGLLGFSASQQQWISLPNDFELTTQLQARVLSHTRQAMNDAQPMNDEQFCCQVMDKLFPNDKNGFVRVDR